MDVTNLTPEQCRYILDFVLKKSYHPRDYYNIQEDLVKHVEYFPNEDDYLLKMALNKLRHDGYIDFVHINGTQQKFVNEYSAGENMTMRRNFNGHVFVSAGGYAGQEQRRIQSETNRNLYDERMETYAKNLATWTETLTNKTDNLATQTRGLKKWTIAVAVGAISLVLWEIIHTVFFEPHSAPASYHFFF